MTEAPNPPPRPRGRGPDPAALAGGAAALLWVVFCVLWFDVAAPWRPAALVARVSPGDPGRLAPRRARLAAGPLGHARRPASRRGRPGPPAGAGARLLLPPARGGRRGGCGGDARRGAVRHRGPARGERQRAARVRSAGALQREPEVAPDRPPRARHGPGTGLRPRLGALLPGLRRGALPPRPPRGRAPGGATRGALRRLQPGLPHALQPQQRRQLRRGARARHVGAVARRPLDPRGRGAGAARLRRRPPPGPRLLVPHPRDHPPGRPGGALRAGRGRSRRRRTAPRNGTLARSPSPSAGRSGTPRAGSGTSRTTGSPSTTWCRARPARTRRALPAWPARPPASARSSG